MALPTFNLPGKNIPDQKQMSMMRSYLSQLKDETESELYDIKWDNLSQSLRDKLNNLDTTINQVSNTADYIAGNLAANYIDAGVISAQYVTSQYIQTNILTAENVLAGTLSAAIAKAGYVETSYLSSNDLWVDNEAFLNKVNGRIASFNYVNADYLSSNTLWADKAFLQKVDGRIGSFGYITAGYVSAGLVSSLFNVSENALFERLNVGDLRVSATRGRTLQLSWHSVNSGGNTIYFLGTTTSPN